MKIFSASEAAAELGIDPRSLRRFLRNDESYRNVGMGGRYAFTESELVSLKRAYLHSSPSTRKVPRTTTDDRFMDDDPGVPVEKLSARGLTPSLRASRQAARAQRQQRLLTRMDAVLTRRADDEVVSDA